ncbi:MAG TPA: vitamin K epoxide reductase family protein [Anaerolineae bacterium]
MWVHHRLAFIEIVLCAAGAGVAAILATFHYSTEASALLCTRAGGCEAVNTSPYSTIGGIPIALIGLGAYGVIGVLAFLSTRPGSTGEYAALAVFGLSLIGVLYSIYLTYLEFFVIRAVCPWCIASAVIMTAIWIVSLVDVSRRRRAAAEADA